MNQLLKTFIACIFIINSIQCKSTVSKDASKRLKRQLAADFDYYSIFMDYSAYDYYDWVCNEGLCQLCDVLTGDCCNPNMDRNCFMPDSCINNPCLSGGTCVSTRTIDNRPDFSCICNYGLTGKYCQLVDEFSPRVIPVPAPIGGGVPPPPVGAPIGAQVANQAQSANQANQAQQQQQSNEASAQQYPSQYQAPATQYQAPATQYQAPATQYQAPVTQYQAPAAQYQAPATQYQAPATQYQAPLVQQQAYQPYQ